MAEHQARKAQAEARAAAPEGGEAKTGKLGEILDRLKRTEKEEEQAKKDRPSMDRPPRNAAADGLQAIRAIPWAARGQLSS